ncbi:acyltransferase family protein [Actinomycetaceae bacterium L2_0104]
MTQATTSPHPARTRIIGLDGLRALAALLVLVFHLLPNWLGSGFVGVDIFFVLSGFLVTSLLIRERRIRGRIDIRAFWLRRVRRLVPAVVVATVGGIAIARCVGGDAIVQLPWQAVGSLTGTYNWLEIVNGSSYFEQQSPLLLTNMWSLAVEQQFYLVWPLLLLVIVRFLPRRLRPYCALAIGALSVGLHVLYVGMADDVTRAYVGTDSHLFGLMIGAAIALWVPRAMTGDMKPASETAKRIWGVLVWVGLIGALSIGMFVPDGPWMYPWGMLGVSVFTGLTIRGLLPDVSSASSDRLAGWLNLRPMVWIGERSYGIYLWHWPLWVVAFFAFDWGVLPTAFAVTALSIVLAHLSYTYIETPIRQLGFLAWMRRGMESRRLLRNLPLAGVGVLAIALFAWGVASSPALSTAQQYVAQGQQALENGKEQSEPSGDPQAPTAPSPDAEPGPSQEPSGEPDPLPPPGDRVTIIGDSVTLASASALQEQLPGSVVDAEVSRSIRVLPSIAGQLDSQGLLREYVVVALATNGSIRDVDVENLLTALGPDRKIVLVTAFGPEQSHWIGEANAQVAAAAAAHPEQIRVADWAAIASASPDVLAGDRIHPDGEGGRLYAQEISRALASFEDGEPRPANADAPAAAAPATADRPS